MSPPPPLVGAWSAKAGGGRCPGTRCYVNVRTSVHVTQRFAKGKKVLLNNKFSIFTSSKRNFQYGIIPKHGKCVLTFIHLTYMYMYIGTRLLASNNCVVCHSSLSLCCVTVLSQCATILCFRFSNKVWSEVRLEKEIYNARMYLEIYFPFGSYLYICTCSVRHCQWWVLPYLVPSFSGRTLCVWRSSKRYSYLWQCHTECSCVGLFLHDLQWWQRQYHCGWQLYLQPLGKGDTNYINHIPNGHDLCNTYALHESCPIDMYGILWYLWW